MPQQIAGLLPMIIFFAIFYFFLIRPQQKQRKERQNMLGALRKGDKIVTIGGIHGTLTDVKEHVVRLKVADNLELKFNREAVGYVVKEAKTKGAKAEEEAV
ncbi:MAG: preprotein translocase subunit YajC [bacterium]